MIRRIIMVAVMLSALVASAAHDKVQLWENGPYWATANIGADNPEDYGYYFWWGDTVGYKRVGDAWVASDGSSSNYSFSGAPTYGKSVDTLRSEGWITADGVLALEHDAAHVHWGGDWRMPTKDEIDALNNNCDRTWTTQNGVNGYLFRGRGDYAAKSIFLPAAGSGDGTLLGDAGSYGGYVSSVPYSDYYSAWSIFFNSSYLSPDANIREGGHSVRPVQGFLVVGQLTPESMVFEKEVDFDQPTVVTFVMDATATARSSGNNSAYISIGGRCKYSVDGIVADGKDEFWPWLYAYAYRSTNTESRVSEGVMYVPAGHHTLHWVWEIGNCWSYGDATAKIDIVNYSEEPLEMKESLYDWGKTLAEDEVWIPGNLEYIHGKQSAQIAAYPTDYEARINRALTTLLRLGESATLRGLIGQFGFSLPDFYIHQPQGEFVGLENAPASTNVVDTALLQAIAAIDAALADIDAIPENWTGNILLDPGKYPAFSEAVYIDRAEVAAMRAALRALRAFTLLMQGYDFEVDYLAVSNAWTNCSMIEEILASAPKAGRVRDLAKMSAAKEDFRMALNCMKKVDEAIVSRTDSLTRTYFLEYDEADETDITEARILLDKAIASLDAAVEVDLEYALTQSSLNKSQLSPDDMPDGFVRQVYLGAIFAGNITRDLVPNGFINSELKEVDVHMDSISDPTIGGLLPQLTLDELARLYPLDQEWSMSAYLETKPEVALRANRQLIAFCTAERDGKLSYTTTGLVPGWIMCCRDWWDGIDYEPVGTEPVTKTIQVERGHVYSIHFQPYENMSEAVSPFTITEMPVAYPDGGPYTEVVDGVEWTFYVENGVAVLDGYDGSVIPMDISGAVTIPSDLGNRPVTTIGEDAFAWCRAMTSLTVPSSVSSIRNAFFKCNLLASIIFLGDKPVDIAEDAFSSLPGACKIYATRAADWSGVAIPGTWQGHLIEYIAGLDSRIEVATSVDDGTYLDVGEEIVLSAQNGYSIYYTTDGSSPVTSSTRTKYAGPIGFVDATTINFCAIDNTTGDWSETRTVSYKVKMPEGLGYTEIANGYNWKFSVVDGEATLEGIVPPPQSDPYAQPEPVASGTIIIPSVLGGHPVTSIWSFGSASGSMFYVDFNATIKIPDSVKSVANSAFSNASTSFLVWDGSMYVPWMYDPNVPSWPRFYDCVTYPGFLAIDGWIVDAVDRISTAIPETVNLKTARGIADMALIVGENTKEVILPDSLTTISSSLGLGVSLANSNLRSIKIPDSVEYVESGALPVPMSGMVSASPLFDYETFPGFAAIDGWIVGREYSMNVAGNSSIPDYCDLSAARGIVAAMNGVTDFWSYYSSSMSHSPTTIILPARTKMLGAESSLPSAKSGISIYNANDLEEVFIPDGVTTVGMGAISMCNSLKKLYLPRSVTNLGDYSWCSGLETLYLPDSLQSKMETWDDALTTSGRPIDIIRNINPSSPVEVIYYDTERYQHTLRFDANGGNVAEAVRKVYRGDLPGFMPTPVREGFAFAGWTLDAAGKRPYDASRIVLADATLYAQWESAYIGHLNSNGALVLSEISEEPTGAVRLPHIIDGSGPVEVIGRELLRGAAKVTSVAIPSTVTTIGQSAFRECLRLESVELPDGLCEIGDNAFRECTSLKSITIPASVQRIGYFAFRDCLRLETVTLLGDPPHQDLGVFMGVPAFTTISGRIGAAMAIIYASITNATDDITVPEGWLDEIATMHNKPADAASYQAAFEAKFGSDLSEALRQPTGKHDLKGNPLYVWQDYVAGTDPLDEEDTFTATIEFVEGVPVVKWSPELPPERAALREYKTYGATALDGNWVDVSGMTDEQRHAAGYQFFQVSVEMKR